MCSRPEEVVVRIHMVLASCTGVSLTARCFCRLCQLLGWQLWHTSIVLGWGGVFEVTHGWSHALTTPQERSPRNKNRIWVNSDWSRSRLYRSIPRSPLSFCDCHKPWVIRTNLKSGSAPSFYGGPEHGPARGLLTLPQTSRWWGFNTNPVCGLLPERLVLLNLTHSHSTRSDTFGFRLGKKTLPLLLIKFLGSTRCGLSRADCEALPGKNVICGLGL